MPGVSFLLWEVPDELWELIKPALRELDPPHHVAGLDPQGCRGRAITTGYRIAAKTRRLPENSTGIASQ